MTELAKLALDEDFEEAIKAADSNRWSLIRKGDLEVWVTLSPEGQLTETFTARLLWLNYPGDLPPSVQFVEPETGLLGVPAAWPTGSGFRPPNDICANWCSEGYDTHPEWRTDSAIRLKIRGNALLMIVRLLKQELDLNFTGRHRP